MYPKLLRVPGPLTCRITSGLLTSENFGELRDELVRDLVRSARAGVSILQVREKGLPASMVFDLVSAVVRELRNCETLCLVNERFDIALAAGADGVHLTSSSIPANIVRSIAGEKLVVGVSTHSWEEVTSAKGAGADFALFGPVFETPSKSPSVGWQGLTALAKACDAGSPMPVLAVGGISLSNFKDVIATGAAGIAAIRLFNDPALERKVVAGREVTST